MKQSRNRCAALQIVAQRLRAFDPASRFSYVATVKRVVRNSTLRPLQQRLFRPVLLLVRVSPARSAPGLAGLSFVSTLTIFVRR